MVIFTFSYAQSVGANHFETSAKNNIGVEDLFLSLTNMVRRVLDESRNFQFLNTKKEHQMNLTFQMINMFDQKRSQENTLSRSNSIRRPNTITVAASEDEDDANGSNGNSSIMGRCCGTG